MSSDDIVNRLRAIASRCWCAEKSQGEPVGKPFFRCESCDDQLQAADEIERLQRWKAEAIEVLNRWDSLCGRTLEVVRIGDRKSDAMAEFVESQRAEIERLRAAADTLAKAVAMYCGDEAWADRALTAYEEARRG